MKEKRKEEEDFPSSVCFGSDHWMVGEHRIGKDMKFMRAWELGVGIDWRRRDMDWVLALNS